MNELFKLALSLSLSGAVLILLILLCCRLLGGRLSKRFQYYIWLVAVLRLLLPFSPEGGLLPTRWQGSPSTVAGQQESLAAPADRTAEDALLPGAADPAPQPAEQPAAAEPAATRLALRLPWRLLWMLWLSVAVGLLIRKITLYQSFVKYLRAGRGEVDDLEVLDRFAELCEQTGARRAIGLYTNRLIASPLILGFFKPAVVLPEIPEDVREFRYICLHELTHHRRRDIFYKWLLQIVLCLHWFNPLVHLMVAEANRCCELSCDEAVLRALDAGERRQYGDTLLKSLQTPGTYREGLAALTLNESAQSLKERLDAIMKFRKPTTITVIAAVLLSALLFTGGYALGAYSVDPQNMVRDENSGYTPEGLPIMSAENRNLFDAYVSPVSITGLLRIDFTPEDISELIAHDGSIMENVLNAMQPELFNEFAGAIPASTLEETLMATLPVHQWTIQDAFGAQYNAATDTYEMYGGLGGGPSTPIVTGGSREGDLITIHYTWYDGDPASDEFQYAAGNDGVLMVRLNGDAFQYVSNKVIPAEAADATPQSEEPQLSSEHSLYLMTARALMQQGHTVFTWYYSDAPYDELWVDADAPFVQVDGAYYRQVGRFQTLEELKAATEAVFTTAFCEVNFYSLFQIGKFRELDGALYVGDQGGISEGATYPPKEYLVRSVEEDTVVLTAICEGLDRNSDDPNAPLVDYAFELVLRASGESEQRADGITWRADSYYGYNADGYQGDLQPFVR